MKHTMFPLSMWMLTSLAMPSVLLADSSLADRLTSSQNSTRESAQSEIATLPDSEKQSLIAQLIHRLKSDEPDQREAAAESLGRLGPAAESAVDPLRKALNDDFPYVRVLSAEALAKIGKSAIPAFSEALKNENSDVRGIAAGALARYGEDAKSAIPLLVKTLQDSDSTVRQRAAHALEQMGPDAAQAVAATLDKSEGTTKILDIQILSKVKCLDESIIPKLIDGLSSEDRQFRLKAAKALLFQGRDHIPELIQGLKSEKPEVRSGIADIFAEMGKHGAQAIPMLTDLLKDSTPEVRSSAAWALGKMGSSAAGAVPALKEAAKDSNSLVATKAYEAWTSITAVIGEAPEPEAKPSAKLQPTTTRQKNVKPSIPTAAPKKKAVPVSKPAERKIKQPPVPRPQIPPTPMVLILTLQNPDAAIHAATEESIIKRSTETMPVLLQMIQGNNSTWVAISVNMLGKMEGGSAKEAVASYRRHKMDKQIAQLLKDLRQGGAAADQASINLVNIGGPVVDRVAPILSDPKPANRLAAAKILNRLGVTSLPAESKLITTLDDDNADVRHEAADALKKLNNDESKKALRFFPIKDRIRQWISRWSH